MAEEERKIEFFLESFENYIVRCLHADCLSVIINYTEFDPDQKQRYIAYNDKDISIDVLHKMFKEIRRMKHNERRYRALFDAVKDNEKVRLILSGEAIPSEDKGTKVLTNNHVRVRDQLDVEQILPHLLEKDVITDRDYNEKVRLILSGEAIPSEDKGTKVLTNNQVRVCDQLDVEQILPYLLEKDVITDRDCDKVRAKKKQEGNWATVPVLLSVLPCKNPAWFQLFVEALNESGHEELGELFRTIPRSQPNKETKKNRSSERDLASSQTERDTKAGDEVKKRSYRQRDVEREFRSLDLTHSDSYLENDMPVRGSKTWNTDRKAKTELVYDRQCQSCPGTIRKEKDAPKLNNACDMPSSSRDQKNDMVVSTFSDSWLKQQNVGESWWPVFKEEINKSYFQKLWRFVEAERQKYGSDVLPKPEDVFSWTNYCTLQEVKVVIIAENPTAGEIGVHGLSFSVEPGYPIPQCLETIYKEVETDINPPVTAHHGYLAGWASQGVLLLNSVLTWRGDTSIPPHNLHKDHDWEVFTDSILSYLSIHQHKLVFMLWGNYVQEKGQIIDNHRHYVLKAGHPSSRSVHRPFTGCRHFSKCNNYLEENGKMPIKWNDL